eukprot:1071437_1
MRWNSLKESESDKHGRRIFLGRQVVSNMKNAIKYYEDGEEKRCYENELLDAIQTVTEHKEYTEALSDTLADAIQYIWNNDPLIHNAFNDLDLLRYQKLDQTTELFWNDMDRIKAHDYIPSEPDILNVRVKTTGVVQKQFMIKNAHFDIFDVGGQKSERRKWINCFNEVKAVLFVIALSCYNEMMYEDV